MGLSSYNESQCIPISSGSRPCSPLTLLETRRLGTPRPFENVGWQAWLVWLERTVLARLQRMQHLHYT